VVRAGEEKSGPFALKMALRAGDARFEREAELLWRARHPNVPRFHGAGIWECERGEFPYVVMEWIEGLGLYEWSRQHNPTSRQVLQTLAQLAGALAVVQAAGGVHRDVKGDNVLVRQADGKPYLTDFGSGWVHGAAVLTQEIFAPGTEQYRSPEAWAYQRFFCFHPKAHYGGCGKDDLFSLGVLAYRLVTDEYPPPTRLGEDGAEVWLDGRGPRPPRELNDKVCRALDEIIMRLVAVVPMQRYRGDCLRAAVALERAAKNAGPEADEPLFAWEIEPAAEQPPESGAVRRQVERRLRRRDAEAIRRAKEREAAAQVELERQEASEQQRAQAPTEKEGAGFAVRRWVLGAAFMAALMIVVMPQRQQSPQAWETPAVARAEPGEAEESKDGGSSGLGDDVSAASVTEAAKEVPVYGPPGFTAGVPKSPLAGQRRPPCRPRLLEVEIRGGCWYENGRSRPPCAEGSYEWQESCYVPVFRPHQEPASEDP
jgi:hypothetical protein